MVFIPIPRTAPYIDLPFNNKQRFGSWMGKYMFTSHGSHGYPNDIRINFSLLCPPARFLWVSFNWISRTNVGRFLGHQNWWKPCLTCRTDLPAQGLCFRKCFVFLWSEMKRESSSNSSCLSGKRDISQTRKFPFQRKKGVIFQWSMGRYGKKALVTPLVWKFVVNKSCYHL